MKLNFCTLFNSNYLTRGLVMYQSLLNNCNDFHLYIIAFDDACYEYLVFRKLNYVTVISLLEFEDVALLKIKSTRTAGEYCWTCTPSTIYYCINQYNLTSCTYIDADLLFYADPKVLIDEMQDNSVLITEHRYTQKYDQTIPYGKYCVQFVSFKNDERGFKVLKWWRNVCLEWCFNRIEDGKFGDQKYLDDWTTRFEGVYELRHLGGGVAPWNVQQYHLKRLKGKYWGIEAESGNKFEIIFFHFHGLTFYSNNIVLLTIDIYNINKNIKKIIYKPYIEQLEILRKEIESKHKNINPSGLTSKPRCLPFNLRNEVGILLLGLKISKDKMPFKYLKDRIEHHHYYYINQI